MATGLFGGAFDPPHDGHVALLAGAERHFHLERVVVLVSEDPGHRSVESPAEVRLELARLAFPGRVVELDPFPRTIDLLRARPFRDPVFLVGSDELAGFPSWKEPDAVLEAARLGVATRPGYPRVALDSVLAALSRPDRVELFDIDPVEVSSTEVRRRVRAGLSIEGLVPDAVEEAIVRLGLYRTGTDEATIRVD